MNCPSCKGPMMPLFTGFFCPKDCDIRQKTNGQALFTISYGGNEYSVEFLKKGSPVPEDRGWFGWWTTDEEFSEEKLRKMWHHPGIIGTPGWESRDGYPAAKRVCPHALWVLRRIQ